MEITDGKSFKGLLVWQQSMDMVAVVYRLCGALPKDEIFGLSSQLRRAMISIPSNIAEGSGRGSRKEFLQYLRIAYGSLCEVETQLLLIQRLELVKPVDWAEIFKQAASVGRLLKLLMRSLATAPSAKTPETSETPETLETL